LVQSLKKLPQKHAIVNSNEAVQKCLFAITYRLEIVGRVLFIIHEKLITRELPAFPMEQM